MKLQGGVLSVLFSVTLLGCSSSGSSDSSGASLSSNSDAVLAKDFVTDVKPKTIKDIKEYTEHPENNVIVNHILEYEGDLLKQITFEGSDSVSGYHTIERDDAGNIIKTETVFNKPTGPEKTTYNEFIYEKDHLVQLKRYFLYEGKFTVVGEHKYEYNDKGQLSKMEVLTGLGKPERTLTYEYTDDSTNPSVVHRDMIISGRDATNTYEYETTLSPLVTYLLVRGYIESALTKNNIKRSTGVADGSDKPEVTIYEYTYNENNLTTKISFATPFMKQAWEFTY